MALIWYGFNCRTALCDFYVCGGGSGTLVCMHFSQPYNSWPTTLVVLFVTPSRSSPPWVLISYDCQAHVALIACRLVSFSASWPTCVSSLLAFWTTLLAPTFFSFYFIVVCHFSCYYVEIKRSVCVCVSSKNHVFQQVHEKWCYINKTE